MFSIARTINRHKLLLAAVLLVAYFLSSGTKQEAPKPSSPWATSAGPVATSHEAKAPTLTDKALKLVNSAAKAAGVEEYLPTSLRDQAIESYQKTSGALDQLNKNQD